MAAQVFRVLIIAASACGVALLYFGSYVLSTPAPVIAVERALSSKRIQVGSVQQTFDQELLVLVRPGDNLEGAESALKGVGFYSACRPITPCSPGVVVYESNVPAIFWPILGIDKWVATLRFDQARKITNVTGQVCKCAGGL